MSLMGHDISRFRFAAGWLAAGMLLSQTGCSHLFNWGRPSPPKAIVKPDLFSTNASEAAVSVNVLQMKTMRFADDYANTIAQACDDFSRRLPTPDARLASMKWKLGQATAAYTDATGVNPVVNALDLLTLVTVSRMVIEDYAVETFGTNALPLLETHRKMEAKAWDLANGTLKPSQRIEFQNLILEWRRQNPNQRYVGAVRFIEFATALGERATSSASSPTSIFSLLKIDPFAGLDPTTAAIEEAQQFGERLMYYSQRLPLLLSWQAQVAAMDMASQPESRQLLTNAQQVAFAADSIARTAAELPQVINSQREAAINQVFDRLTAEGTNAVAVLRETRGTLDASSEAAKSISAAIKSLDEFVRYISPTNTSASTVGSTNNRSFNVLDYGTVAGQIGTAARDLNVALQTLNQSTPELIKLSRQASERADHVVTRAFWLGLILIVVFTGGLALAARFWRISSGSSKLTRDTDQSSR